ncbi:Alpha-xylosidase [compost metagenome]
MKYYLPEGRWTHLLTGEVVDGGKWRKETHDFLSLPLYVRPNSILSFGAENTKVDYDLANDVKLVIYELEEGAEAHAVVRSTTGEAQLLVTATREADVIELKASGAGKAFRITVNGRDSLSVLDGTAPQPESSEIRVPDWENEVTIRFKVQ